MKQKTLKTLLVCLLAFAGMSKSYAYDIAVANADGVTIYYNNIFINDQRSTELEVTHGEAEYKGTIVIPQSVTYDGEIWSVTSIGSHAFHSCSDLTSVTIPNSVTFIGDEAFYSCRSLTSVTIPNSVTFIGDGAFWDCTGLTEVTIGNGVTSIGNDAFDNCWRLTEVTIPNSVTSIGYQAFRDCFGLTEVTIPNSVTSIGGGAFRDCSSLTSVTIPNSVTTIGGRAFYHCESLTKATIGNSVTSIGGYAFALCWMLTDLTIPNSVTSIGDGAFQNCNSLTEVTIPRSVTAIGWNPFVICYGLKNITVENGNPNYDSRENCNAIIQTDGNVLISGCRNTQIPNGVEVIGYDAFNGSHLAEINLPNSVTAICGGAFRFCTDLENITVEDGNPYFDSREGCNAIIETSSNKLIVGSKNTTIPNSVTAIGDSVFYNYKSLTEFTIGNGVTSIGNYAFAYCTSLTELTIPSSVTSIGNYAFRGCSGLTTLYSLNTTPAVISTGTFDSNHYSNVNVFVPAEALEAYQTADVWKEFQKLQAIPDDGGTTAIEQVQVNADTEAVTVYTLSGQKVANVKKGIYIKNGKMVVVK